MEEDVDLDVAFTSSFGYDVKNIFSKSSVNSMPKAPFHPAYLQGNNQVNSDTLGGEILEITVAVVLTVTFLMPLLPLQFPYDYNFRNDELFCRNSCCWKKPILN